MQHYGSSVILPNSFLESSMTGSAGLTSAPLMNQLTAQTVGTGQSSGSSKVKISV